MMTPSGDLPVQTRELRVQRGSVVLDHVELSLARGTFACIVGPSGSGKTSLLRVLALLDEPRTGSLLLWGNEFGRHGKCPREAAYPRLSYVPQTLDLWPHLSIRQNLLFATPRTDSTTRRLQDLAQVLEIEGILDQKPARVSQGQRQRSSLVRALLLEPEVLLLDEVTAALDGRLATTVWRLLRSFADDGGAILASTHDSELAKECDVRYRIQNQELIVEHSSKTGDCAP